LKSFRNSTSVIAIVDDDEPFREAIGSILKAAGFAVSNFGTAEEFFDCSQRESTGCLILDVRLPGMSGIELQRRMQEARSTTPIVFVTAHGDDRLRDLLKKAGAAAFLNKPVRSDALLKEIRAVVPRDTEDRAGA
jgi:two-component system, LuxR family, response regulator FixJ